MRRHWLPLATVSAAALTIGACGPADPAGSPLRDVSLIQLVAMPHEYEGRVRVRGYCSTLAGGLSFLFLDPPEGFRPILRNGVRLDLSDSGPGGASCTGELVLVEGLYREAGPTAEWNGVIHVQATERIAPKDSLTSEG